MNIFCFEQYQNTRLSNLHYLISLERTKQIISADVEQLYQSLQIFRQNLIEKPTFITNMKIRIVHLITRNVAACDYKNSFAL